jgi:hypothetical protein
MKRIGKFQNVMQAHLVEGVQIGARWLAEAMRQMVDIQCGATTKSSAIQSDIAAYRRTSPKRTGHAGAMQPPRRESGEGQRSIGYAPTKMGAVVGVRGIGTTNMIGANYMAGWDSPDGIRGHRHPWLSRFFTVKRYQTEFNAIIKRHLKLATGAR